MGGSEIAPAYRFDGDVLFRDLYVEPLTGIVVWKADTPAGGDTMAVTARPAAAAFSRARRGMFSCIYYLTSRDSNIVIWR